MTARRWASPALITFVCAACALLAITLWPEEAAGAPRTRSLLASSVRAINDRKPRIVAPQPIVAVGELKLVERMNPRPAHPQAAVAEKIPTPLSYMDELLEWSDCPQDYPYFVALGTTLHAWTADEPEPPPEFRETVRVFDFNLEGARELATKYRNCEVPFKVINAPEALSVVELWTDDYLNRSLWGNTDVAQEIQASSNSHFMYWRHDTPRPPGWQPPTYYLPQPSFSSWLPAAKRADDTELPWQASHLYYGVDQPERGEDGRAGLAPEQLKPGDFIARDLPFFANVEPNFWVPKIQGRSGIQCRFSMRGVATASHYDNGRNYVLMLRGAKRYLLNPPGTCSLLGIVMDVDNPSYRHTDAFWTWRWPENFEHAAAVDVLVNEGEALYIPSFWFHFIVSTDYNIQCNARSGFPDLDPMPGLAAVQHCLHVQKNVSAETTHTEEKKEDDGHGRRRRLQGVRAIK